MARTAHTHLMFQNGKAEEALHRYEEVFGDGFTLEELDTYPEGGDAPAGKVQLAVCTLLGQRLTVIDSPIQHDFDMTPAISLFVECENEDELETIFEALADAGEVFMPLDDYGFSQKYGWVGDRFGVSWQLNLA